MSTDNKAIIYLDRNENQYGPAPKCFDVLRNIDSVELYEYSRDFARGVKSRLSERLAKDFGIAEKNVMVGYGGEDILKQAVHCYIHKGDKIMIPAYSWWYYKKISDEKGGIKIEYPIVEGKDSFYYDIEGMIKVYREEKPKLVLISSPNNPTGNRLEIEQLMYVLEEMKDTVVILDEAYTLFYNKDNSHLKKLVEKYPNLIIIRTFSKYYGLAGIRIGFALMGDNHADFNMFSARYLGYNRLTELIGLAALDSADYYSEMREKMTADMDMFFNEFNAMPGFKAFKSYSNFILVEIPEQIKDGLKKYLTERNMIVKFMAEDGLFKHLRITIGTQEQNKLLMKMIKDYLKENN
ncbi:MAG: histidinol-phosphate transaminase [Bacteroidetes bacterium]|nr:histidinol-phosphate transaminase [Bacteroidota bacterium]